jgi:hypothetical protein
MWPDKIPTKTVLVLSMFLTTLEQLADRCRQTVECGRQLETDRAKVVAVAATAGAINASTRRNRAISTMAIESGHLLGTLLFKMFIKVGFFR